MPRLRGTRYALLLGSSGGGSAGSSGSEGPLYPGTLASDSSFGFVPWSDPGNAGAQDTTYATCNVGLASDSEYLLATNFGFAIPGGASITGIRVSIVRKSSVGSTATTLRARLVKAGVVGSTDYSDGSYWSTSDGIAVYGGSTDLWGDVWTPSDINDSGFGFALAAGSSLSATVSIDVIRITVYYTT